MARDLIEKAVFSCPLGEGSIRTPACGADTIREPHKWSCTIGNATESSRTARQRSKTMVVKKLSEKERRADMLEELRVQWRLRTAPRNLLRLLESCWCNQPLSAHDGPGCHSVLNIIEPLKRKLRLWCAALFDLSSFDYERGGSGGGSALWPAWRDGLADPGEIFVSATGEEWNQPAYTADLWADTNQDQPGDPPLAVRTALLRDVLGEPFRPAPEFRDEWRTSSVLAVAGKAWGEHGDVCRFCSGRGRTGTDGEECSTCGGRKRVGAYLDPVTLGILGDALEDAGCDDERIITHLRSAHERPCATKNCGGREVWTRDARPGAVRQGVWKCRKCGRADASEGQSAATAHVRGCWALDLVRGEGGVSDGES